MDNTPSYFQHIINRLLVDNLCRHPPFPHFHRPYYYYGYLFINLIDNIKKKKGPRPMKITCVKSELSSALSIVSKAIASKPQTPILAGIFLRAENNILELHATNNEIGLVCRIPVEIEEPGQLAVSGRYFLEVIRKLPGDSLTIAYNRTEKIINITSNQANFTLLSMNAAEFPTVKEIEANIQFSIKDMSCSKWANSWLVSLNCC